MSTSPVPGGYATITPSITCRDAKREIEFLKAALGAEVRHVMTIPGTEQVMHAEVKIGTSVLMLNDVMPGCSKAPADLGGAPGSFYLYVADVDAAFARAVKAGGQSVCEPMDMFWGDRMGAFACPEGYNWSLATHVRDCTPEQMVEGQKQFLAQMQAHASAGD